MLYFCSFLIGSSYGYFNDFHITTYGESILLAAQSEQIMGVQHAAAEPLHISPSPSTHTRMHTHAGAIILYLTVKYGRKWNAENGLLLALYPISCLQLRSVLCSVSINLASFPGPAQLSVAKASTSHCTTVFVSRREPAACAHI